jgi:L-ectoine synthase
VIIRNIKDVKTVEWGNGLSRRFLLEADGMGYTVTDTIVRKGTKSLIEYENHLEACYCIEGSGKVIEMDGTEHDINVGDIYALNNRDPHYLLGGENEDLRLVCMFTPALVGDEHHDFSNPDTPSVYSGSPIAGVTSRRQTIG